MDNTYYLPSKTSLNKRNLGLVPLPMYQNQERSEWVEKLNYYGSKRIPILFILDFELLHPLVFTLDDIPSDVFYKINLKNNYHLSGQMSKPLIFEKYPITFQQYRPAFDEVMREILYGNTFLLNLSMPTTITTNYTLKELFNISHAKYKLYFKDQFIVSSPESFVIIKENKIFTYPMKGTIDASIPGAADIIIKDEKEVAEHYTIVDLLRNDISQVAKNVKVNRFRYIENLQTNNKNLLQVSSEIEGTLPRHFNNQLGEILMKMLPAGSISGAPKDKTVEIIKKVEPDSRGYYTGIFGIFDGYNLDSGVMIRFLEKNNITFTYRSGCGITYMSDCESEYYEMIDKIYVPINRKY
jgi:para-aminobenzoate synthetase component 1